MNIKFSKEYSIDDESGNYTFSADVDGKPVQCIVSDQALQDFIPSNATIPPEELFKKYRALLEIIAVEKISAPEFDWGPVRISKDDMTKCNCSLIL